ncbi:MAG: 5-(carboxyamino)imidazole ribonucleotide mutase [Defluviitaleaceae bacterium]|nr:5-(carboxyamino)imidazole ribonucleotide mutase [Defluviitaleaceae bacterium]
MQPLIAIIMGSDSDWPLVKKAADMLASFGVQYDVQVMSAHRTPERVRTYVTEADAAGTEVFIAAAGKAAHLPGVVASLTTKPVIGLPVKSSLDGLDALLSIVQMPPGIPVATVAIDGAENAAILAVQIVAGSRPVLAEALKEFRRKKAAEVDSKNEALRKTIM